MIFVMLFLGLWFICYQSAKKATTRSAYFIFMLGAWGCGLASGWVGCVFLTGFFVLKGVKEAKLQARDREQGAGSDHLPPYLFSRWTTPKLLDVQDGSETEDEDDASSLVEGVKDEQKQTEIYCPSCKEVATNDERFCVTCGTRLPIVA